MTGEDSHLEAAYEDANGDPHGIGSPEWDEEEYDEPEADGVYVDGLTIPYEDEEPNPYHGTCSEM